MLIVIKIKNYNKFKYIILYCLCFTLILSSLALLAGCAPYSSLKGGNEYKNCWKKNALQKKLENKVLAASLKLNGVSDKKIKILISSNGKNEPVKKSGDGSYIDPPFMKGESNIIKSPAERRFRIAIDKTAESRNGKIILKALSVKSDKIFEIISFSLANLYSSPLECRLFLLGKSGENAEYKNIRFKSNIETEYEGKKYFTLQGSSKIKGEIIFLNNGGKSYKDSVSRLTLGISALYKSRLGGGIKFLKLLAKL